MNYTYNFDLDCFNNDTYINALLEYKIQESGLLQKELVAILDIPSATFTRAKKNGYASNKIIYNKLLNYFQIQIASAQQLNKYEQVINELMTLVYYQNATKQIPIFENIIKDVNTTKESSIRPVFWIILSISANFDLYSKQEILDILKEDLALINYIKDYLPLEIKYLTLYALYEYALHIMDLNLQKEYVLSIENILKNLSEELQPFAYFLCLSHAGLSGDYLNGIKFANRCLELQQHYFSPQINTAIKYHLFVFYNITSDYEKMINLAKGEILYLQFDEEKQLFYISFLIGMSQAYTNLGKFKEALTILSTLSKYDWKNTKLKPQYIPVFQQKIKLLSLFRLFIYYKTNDKLNFDETLSYCEELNQPQYVEIIKLLQKKNINSLKKVNTILEELAQEPLQGLNHLYYALKNEYQNLSSNK